MSVTAVAVRESPVAAIVTIGHDLPSVLVLTKDEEINIAACLETLSFSDDVVVLDSYSTDRTVEIARSFPNVRVVQRHFDTWSKHSNWALDNIQFKHRWVYYSDADERITPELRDELIRVANDPQQPHVAYRVRYQNMFMGRWLRYGGIYPVWIIRYFQPPHIRYEDRQVNAHPVIDGSLGDLHEHFIHFSFNKGLQPWLGKHNSYSAMEAQEGVRVREHSLWAQCQDILHGNPGRRRRALKNLSFFLPNRGVVRFLYMYVLKAGFLDGRAGFQYAAMISMYEYWIALKMREYMAQWPARTKMAAQALLQESEP
ncbi:MAG: glycosyltransferase family 2 protein [Phycisphaeraceae bacterium]